MIALTSLGGPKSDESMKDPAELGTAMKPRIALALSGGGFRASLFHLGLLRRVAELGWLKSVDIISTVSGGSIIGAYMTQRWNEFIEIGGDGSAFDRVVSSRTPVTSFLVGISPTTELNSSFIARSQLG